MFFFCTATGIQIRVAGMKIQDPNQLDDRRICKAFVVASNTCTFVPRAGLEPAKFTF